MSTKKKYVDSHWLVFTFQGVAALLFGWFAIFTNLKEHSGLIALTGLILLFFGVIELFNLLHRTHLKLTWGLTLGIAILEIAAALTLLFSINQNPAWHIGILSGYVLTRGVLEILLGLRSVDDRTDRAIWVISGISGAILSFVILNSGSIFGSPSFFQCFGVYMSIFGLATLIYGIHNRDQSKLYAEERSLAAKKAAKTRRLQKTNKRSR